MPIRRVTPSGGIRRVAPEKKTQPAPDLTPSGGYWDEAVAVPEADVSLPSKEVIEPFLRPTLEYGGLTAGGLIAAPSGPAGTVLGAGLGYGIGKKAADVILGKKAGTVSEELQKSVDDVSSGMMIEMGGQVFGKLVSIYGEPTAKKLNSVIRKGIAKAIRPGAKLQKTAAQMRLYYDRAKIAVSEIVANRKNLVLTDAEGEIVSGLPKTLSQFSEAIQQTKEMILKEYDEMARVAEHQGLTIDLQPIIKRLESEAADPIVQDLVPEAVAYIRGQIARLSQRRIYTATEAQRAITTLNQGLKSFYRNPSLDTTSRAYIDDLIARKLRSQLDDGIAEYASAGYQELKNAYGALSHIEQDVARRAVVDARKNTMGLIDFTDVFSGYQTLAGVLQADPARAAAGTGATGIAKLYRWLNNPNRVVKNLFEDVEKIISKSVVPIKPAGKELVGRTVGYVAEKEE